MEENELYHYGKKGMKWHQHIYQKQNGSLNRLGRYKYERELARLKKEKAVLRNKERTKKKLEKLDALRSEVDAKRQNVGENTKNHQQKPQEKSIKQLSNQELRGKIVRAQLEKPYSNLTKPAERAKMNKAKEFVGDVLERSGKNIGTQFTTYVMGTAVNKAFARVYGDNAIVNPKKGQKDK